MIHSARHCRPEVSEAGRVQEACSVIPRLHRHHGARATRAPQHQPSQSSAAKIETKLWQWLDAELIINDQMLNSSSVIRCWTHQWSVIRCWTHHRISDQNLNSSLVIRCWTHHQWSDAELISGQWSEADLNMPSKIVAVMAAACIPAWARADQWLVGRSGSNRDRISSPEFEWILWIQHFKYRYH